MGVTLVQFQEICIFPIDFNDFINSSGHFSTEFGSFGGHFGAIFGIWGDFEALSEPVRWRKALDGKCDVYMWGLGGARKRKC